MFKSDFENYISYKDPVYINPEYGRNISCREGCYEYDWLPADTEKLFIENFKKDPKNESLLYYAQNPIKYKLNKQYFRTYDDFDVNEPGNVFLGCSHTFGIGNHLENTWSYLVNEQIDGKFYNMGIPGASIQNVFSAFAYYVEKLTINNVFIFLPHPYRFVEYHDSIPYTYNLSEIVSKSFLSTHSRRTVDNYISPEYTYLIFYAFLNALENLCKKNNIPCFFLGTIPTTTFGAEGGIKARDLSHFSINLNKILASTMLKMYEKDIQLDSNKYKLWRHSTAEAPFINPLEEIKTI